MRPSDIPKNLEEYEVHGVSEIFTAIDPIEGLMAYGPYDVPKRWLRWWIDDDGAKVFLIEVNGQERIVRLLKA